MSESCTSTWSRGPDSDHHTYLMRNYGFITGAGPSFKSGTRTLHPRPRGVSPGPRFSPRGWPRATEDARPCARPCGRVHGARRRGGERAAQRVGQQARTASSRRAPPRARGEWFGPAPAHCARLTPAQDGGGAKGPGPVTTKREPGPDGSAAAAAVAEDQAGSPPLNLPPSNARLSRPLRRRPAPPPTA